MELEELHVLSNDMGSRTVLLVAAKLIVDFHNVRQFVGQVILRQNTEVRTQSRRTCMHRHRSLSPSYRPYMLSPSRKAGYCLGRELRHQALAWGSLGVIPNKATPHHTRPHTLGE